MDFFRGFDLVLNGLDNLEARRHVNRLCLAAKVPLVESGTAGYLGQVPASNCFLLTSDRRRCCPGIRHCSLSQPGVSLALLFAQLKVRSGQHGASEACELSVPGGQGAARGVQDSKLH